MFEDFFKTKSRLYFLFRRELCLPVSAVAFYVFNIYSWLHWVLAAVHGFPSIWGAEAQSLGLLGLVAPWHEGFSSLTKDPNHLPCTGRWSLNHWTTREVPVTFYFIRRTLVGVTILSSSFLNTSMLLCWYLLSFWKAMSFPSMLPLPSHVNYSTFISILQKLHPSTHPTNMYSRFAIG